MAEEEPLVGVDGGASQDTSQTVPSASSVFFKGTISEAIAEAQAGWKILLVYVAGENEDSIKMSEVTWQDPKIIEQVSEWCISLYLLEGSKDAMNFSALYPVSGTPNLTLLGHNGLLLKKHEGYISPEDLLDMLQQYILKLQNAAANAVIAALSSSARSLPVNNASESSSAPNNETGSSNAASPQIHSSSDMSTFQVPPSHGTPSPIPKSEYDGHIIAGSSAAAVSSNVDGLIEQNCHVDTVLCGRQEDLQDNVAEFEASTHLTSYLGIDNIQNITDGTTDTMHNLNVLDRQKTSEDDNPVKNKTYPILLQIRLTNGNCIQGQFTVHDSLEAVKSFVDMNRTDGTCSYSLAVPYPRKVFSDQDMLLTLLELDIKTRATLMLIPKQSLPSSSNDAAFISNREETPNCSTPTGSMFWQLISFLNPFSYWGRTKYTTTSAGQYGQSMALNTDLRNSSPQRDIGDGTSYRHLGSFSREEATTSSISGQIQHNNPGSNIHTLQHDEDDIFRKGNAFWNGNSTQFGSDNSKPSN